MIIPYSQSTDHHRLLGYRTSDLTSTSSGISCALALEALPNAIDVSPALYRQGACHPARRCLHKLRRPIAAEAGVQPSTLLWNLQSETISDWPKSTFGADILLGKCRQDQERVGQDRRKLLDKIICAGQEAGTINRGLLRDTCANGITFSGSARASS